MWEVMTYGERPYWELSNHEVASLPAQACPGPELKLFTHSLPRGLGREEFRGPVFLWYRPSMGSFSQCLLRAYCVPGLVQGFRPSI